MNAQLADPTGASNSQLDTETAAADAIAALGTALSHLALLTVHCFVIHCFIVHRFIVKHFWPGNQFLLTAISNTGVLPSGMHTRHAYILCSHTNKARKHSDLPLTHTHKTLCAQHKPNRRASRREKLCQCARCLTR